MAQNLKINDKVLVISGDNKGKEAKIVKIGYARRYWHGRTPHEEILLEPSWWQEGYSCGY